MDWRKWHGLYRNRWSLRTRLVFVQREIDKALASTPEGPVQVLSICAGDGRDLAGVMKKNQRAKDISALLIELNENLVKDGRAHFESLGLAKQIDYRAADATDPKAYDGFEAADIVLACGMLGLVTPASTPNFVKTLASLVKPDGYLIWTRSLTLRSGEEHLKQFKSLLSENGFVETSLQTTPPPPFFLRGTTPGSRFVIGAHQYKGKALKRPRRPLFEIADL